MLEETSVIQPSSTLSGQPKMSSSSLQQEGSGQKGSRQGTKHTAAPLIRLVVNVHCVPLQELVVRLVKMPVVSNWVAKLRHRWALQKQPDCNCRHKPSQSPPHGGCPQSNPRFPRGRWMRCRRLSRSDDKALQKAGTVCSGCFPPNLAFNLDMPVDFPGPDCPAADLRSGQLQEGWGRDLGAVPPAADSERLLAADE